MYMKKIILIILLSLFAFGLNTVGSYRSTNLEYTNTSFLQEELNDSILYLALVHYEVKHPKAVLAQAKLESGNYTSSLFKNNNNFLGLYNSKKKKYFKFNYWSECILAYKDMVEYKHREGENYYHFLKRIGYAEDPEYIAKIKRVESNLKNLNQ